MPTGVAVYASMEIEGFGLPPVEAALSGNAVIGYTGESGKEYWRTPIFDEVFSGDVRTFANKVISKAKDFNENNYAFGEIEAHLSKLAGKYSVEKEQRSLLPLVDLIKKF